MKVLVTGVNGFVGKELARELINDDKFLISGAVRSLGQKMSYPLKNVDIKVVGDVHGETDWTEALSGVHAVVHLAARVHVMNESDVDSYNAYKQVNVDGTANLVKQAVAHGVKRFIYLSSIKVNGEERDRVYTENDQPMPEGSYAISKWKAEELLKRVAQEAGIELIIIRPPLVYGAGVQANFLKLIDFVNRGNIVPFGMFVHKRSLIFVGNLVSAIKLCLTHPKAPGNTFLVSDGEDMSVRDLVAYIADALKVKILQIPVPIWSINFIGRIIGKSQTTKRLTMPLCVNCNQIKNSLGWIPPFSVNEGISFTVDWYQGHVSCKGSH